jgi:WD40 repeat protein
MRMWRIAALAALAGLWLCPRAEAQTTRTADDPRKQSLVLPIPPPVSGGKDGRDLRCVVSFGPAVSVSALAFSGDGKRLFAGGYREVLVWDLVEGKLARRLGAGDLSGTVRTLLLVDDGKLLIVGEGMPGESGEVALFDVQKNRLVASLSGPRDVVQCLAISPDGQFLVAGAAEPNVYIWKPADPEPVATLPGHGDGATGVSFSPDGKLLATGGTDRQLRIWEVDGWKESSSLPLPEPITDVAFSPDGRLVAAAIAGPAEWTVRVQQPDKPKEARVFYSGGTAPLRIVWRAEENGRARKMYLACNDNSVRAVVGGGTPPAVVMRGHSDWVCGLAVSPDGTRLASGSLDGTVRLWNEADGRLLATLVQLTPGTDEWIVATAPGFLSGSSPEFLQWRAKGIVTTPTDLTAAFNDPESVRKVLAGEKVAPPALK